MFDPFVTEDSDLDTAIADLFANLARHDGSSEEYQKTADQLTKLYALKNATAQLTLQAQQSSAAQQLANDQNAWQEEQDMQPFWKRIEPNTVAVVAGNLAVAVVVVKYEQTGVIASKVLSFMRKI